MQMVWLWHCHSVRYTTLAGDRLSGHCAPYITVMVLVPPSKQHDWSVWSCRNVCRLQCTGGEDLLSRLGRISHVQRCDVRLPQCGDVCAAVVPRVSMWVVEITSFWRKIFEEHHEFRRLLFSLHPHHTVHIQKLLLCSYGLTMLNQEFWNTRCSWQSKNFRSVFSEGLLHFVILGESIKSRIVKSLIEVYITRKF